MNSHLNIFKSYSKSNSSDLLENDLTRAFAISIQEDSLFFHELLKEIFKDTQYYSQLFGSLESETTISIDIQKKTNQITDYELIFAISLSGQEMSDFWNSKNNSRYNPICDLVIKINDFYLIIEVKKDDTDCTSQLYNQIFNIIKVEKENFSSLNEKEHSTLITPYDLNWKKLMLIAVRVLSFEKSFGNANRFLSDFVSLVKDHNYKWLPESPINSLQSNNKRSILRRIESAIIEASKTNDKISKLPYNDRLGIVFFEGWAQEILFGVNEFGDLSIEIYPGNTRAQGSELFSRNIKFKDKIRLLNDNYDVAKLYHVKFTSFQRYFTGLWFKDDELKEELYTLSNYKNYTGRKRREEWGSIENLFDKCFKYDWKEQCKWNTTIINSGKSQFDLSFGYFLIVTIPFNKLKEIDTEHSQLTNLINLIENVYSEFRNILLYDKTN